MGDFEEAERLRAGIREWLRRAARSGRHELRDVDAPSVLPLLCAAAFGSAQAEAESMPDAAAVAGTPVAGSGVLSSVRADVLADVLDGAAGRATGPGLQQEIRNSIRQVLAADDKRADGLRSDIAMVMREIDAGGTMFRAAIETGNEDFEREVLTAVEAVSTEFGDMAFLLADLARAAGEIQDSLGSQGSELRMASEQVGRQSADVRMIREELALIERRSRQWTSEPVSPGPRWTGGCPYLGLLPYDQAQEAVFFGRERLTAELAGKLAESGIIIVSGASGAGKTSLLQAGLVPALARGVQVPGSSSWPRLSITPTARPLTELAAGLASVGGGDSAAIGQLLADAPGEAHLLVREIMLATSSPEPRDQEGRIPGGTARLVLIIDQFEQIFAATDLECAMFIDAVVAAATKPAGARGEPPARVVIAVRGDFWDQCAAYPQLVRAMEQNHVVVGPMPEACLRRVIAGPAEASGLRVDSTLIDAILSDARLAKGPQLPLLSQAMMLTWERREGGRLTREGYEHAGLRGQISRAVQVSAEAVYTGLPEDQRALTREVFRKMTALGQDHRPVRKAVTRADLRAGRPNSEWPQVGAVLEAFARSHLLVLGADAAEIAHEVLLEAWPRLRDWLEEDQASMVLHGQLAEDTARWRGNGKDSSLLYREVQLAAVSQAARVWEADPDSYPALTADEADFLRVGGRAARWGQWRRRALAIALVALVVVALAGAGLAVRSARNNVSQQRTTDVSGQLAAQSTALSAVNPVMASLLAGAAWRVAPTAQARYSLLESLAQPVRGILPAQSGLVTAVAYSPDGKTLAAGYQDGAIRLWNLASHRAVAGTTWATAPLALAFADGGKALEVADPSAIGVWNLTSQARLAAQPLAGATAGATVGGLASGSVAFSADGKTLATGGDDGNVRLWDVATQQEIGAPMSSGLRPVDAVAFSPAGAALAAASSDGTVQLWDVATQQETGSAMVADPVAVRALAFGPAGKVLATGGDDGEVRLWDVATHVQDGATMATGGPVAALAFSADGTTIATAQSRGGTELWASASQKQTGAPLTPQGPGGVSALAFGPGALATGGGNGTIQLWNPAGFHQASVPLAISTPEPPAAANGHAPAVLSADGEILAVSNSRGTVRLWNTRTRRLVGIPIASHHAVTGLALSPDGKTLAVVANGLQLWAPATGQPIGAPLAAGGGAVAFSPDGTLVATVGRDGKVRLWRLATQRQAGAPMTDGGTGPVALAFSPDGKTLAMVGANGTAKLWSVATQRRTGAPMTAGTGTQAAPGGTAAATFSPDGTRLATAADGTVRVWDTATQQEIGVPMEAGTEPVYALAFSPDGTQLASADGDGTARLWDTATQQEVGTPMTDDAQPVYAAAFGQNGTQLVTVGGDGTARRWDVAFPAGLLAAACAIADQSLTRQQWADYAGNQPFQQVCPAS